MVKANDRVDQMAAHCLDALHEQLGEFQGELDNRDHQVSARRIMDAARALQSFGEIFLKLDRADTALFERVGLAYAALLAAEAVNVLPWVGG